MNVPTSKSTIDLPQSVENWRRCDYIDEELFSHLQQWLLINKGTSAHFSIVKP